MLPGRTFVAIRHLTLLENIINIRESSRFIQNQIHTQMLMSQLHRTIEMCHQIVFAKELTFFDRTMLNYTTPLKKIETHASDLAQPKHLVESIHSMKRVFVTLLHSCGLSWARWLDARNENIWLSKHKNQIIQRF